MRGLKAILGAAAVASVLFVLPSGSTATARAQISFSLNLGAPPSCRWGYFDYPPYQCAPRYYYGPGYFYNGIFLGVGPWHEWGYRHGWGEHRFVGARGGHYVANSHGDFTHGRGRGDDRAWHDDHRDNHADVHHDNAHRDNHANAHHDNHANAHHDNHAKDNHAKDNKHHDDNH